LAAPISSAANDSPALIVVSFSLAISGFAGGQSILNDATMNLVDPQVRGVAVGMFNLVLNLGGTIGAAALAALSGALGLQTSLLVLAALPAAGAGAALLTRTTTARDTYTATVVTNHDRHEVA
jgi:predicted MFS family arabinose efflux permease